MAETPLAVVPTEDFPNQEDALQALTALASGLSDQVASGDLRQAVSALPLLDVTSLDEDSDLILAERLHQAYSFIANAYLWLPGQEPLRVLPPQIAVPYAALSVIVDRPPVLSYAGTQLCNWRKRVSDGGMEPENLEPIQVFQDLKDEAWFWVIHIAIEAAGGPAAIAAREMPKSVESEDEAGVIAALTTIREGLAEVTALAKRIEEGCGPDVFFKTLRPFLFSPPEGVVFEGVEALGGKPQAFLGQTGAQSALLPAICGGLGIRHGRTELTVYLDAVRAYMPAPHRDFLAGLDGQTVRAFVARGQPEMRKLYNDSVDAVAEFRKFHLTLAARYIAANVPDPKGTGGTDFMRWLKHMTRETEDQRLLAQ